LKLPPAAVESIRSRVGQGETISSLSREYGVGRTAVSSYARGVPRALFHERKLSLAQVDEIRRRRASGENIVALARAFAVTPTAIWLATRKSS
jgi:hypothetical protein